MKNLSWKTKLIGGLLLLLPLYFAVAALGTKFGVWGWQFGLGAMIIVAGPILLGIVAVVSLVLLVMALLKKPRQGWVLPAIGLVVPLGIFGMLASVGSTADKNPIHDVATDTADPPQFSARTMAAREKSGANPLLDYQQPLREFEMYKDSPPEIAIKSHAQIITDSYATLSPLPLGGASKQDAVAAVAAAMGSMGFSDISTDAEAGIVEGVATSFWFGVKDDVVARISENEIDFRSVSRVGRSDLGANAKRIAELRGHTSKLIGQR